MGNYFNNENEDTTPNENFNTDNNINKDINNNENSTKNETNIILSKKRFVWIDPLIDNEENTYYYNHIFVEKKLNCKKYNNIDEAYNFLIKKQNEFKEIIIIISGKLFINFYYKIKNNINKIKFSPNIILFTSRADLTINQLKMNNIYYDNDLFNTKLIFTNPSEIEDFLNDKVKNDYDLTFDIIDSLDQLIIPNYFSYLLEDANLPEILYFNSFLKSILSIPTEKEKNELMRTDSKRLNILYGNETILKLLNQIEYRKLPKEIIIKYWLRIYSIESEFYNLLNESFRREDKHVYFYYPFIKLCYEGIKKGFIKSYNKEIYRYSKLTKKEFKNIREKYNENKNDEIPKIIVFSKSFLSFSMDKETIKDFKGKNEKTFCILYVIEEIENKDNTKNKVSNAIIEDFSNQKYEKEVLVFPFSCFEIVNIKEIKADDVDYEIHLKYLGNYSKYIKEEFGANFFDKIQVSNFSKELIDKGIVPVNNIISIWKKKEEIKIKVDKICFFLDGQEDFISFSENEIIIFNIYSSKAKLNINIHKDKILDIIKMEFNRICSCSKDKTIKIIKLEENNEKYSELHIIDLKHYYAIKVNFLENEDIIFMDNINNISFFTLKDKNYKFDRRIKEKDEILIMKKLFNNKIVYISENKEENKLINFIDLKERKKEENNIIIEEKEKKLKLVDIIIFYDYILIAFDCRIDIINYINKPFKVNSLNFFDFKITNMIILSSNRIILGLYDSVKKESIIREHILKIKDLKNYKDKFDCLGQGCLENEKIENIIKLNESQIVINIKNNSSIIYERKNEIGERLKQNLLNKSKNEILVERKNNINIINIQNKIIKKEKNINLVIQKSEDFKLVSFKQKTISGIIPQQQLNFGNKQQYSNQFNNQYQHFRSNINRNTIPFQGNNNSNYLRQNTFEYQKSVAIKNKDPSLNKESVKNFNSPYEKDEIKSLKEFFPEANKETLTIKPNKTSKEEKKFKLDDIKIPSC